ncbi:MAG: hypothetical protein QOJ69_1214 [Actinomycetota bacterium]|nr:hypothetical protein [Actinomycetota bacterium]MEA2843543.1 hypothetical protein [Actinomycetota bacterium]
MELGYDYCLREECQQKCMKRVLLASVGVNKAADHYVRADEILPPPSPPTPAMEESDELPQSEPRPRRAVSPRRIKTTLERLRQKELELDDALRGGYERFCRGEWTAREMDREHDRLVREFNQQVMQENIRYRSLLRKTTSPGR